jgi:hypothetical protein
MRDRVSRKRALWLLAALALALYLPGQTEAQLQSVLSPPPTKPAKAAAPIDLTGYWVTVITQDWRWRMVTPAKGDYAGVPITAKAKRDADTWDPVKDELTGAACKSYGAPGLMRAPTRLHITWQDDNTLKVETDYGIQTRLLHFGNWKGRGSSSLQGDSVAEWEIPRVNRGRGDPEPLTGRGEQPAPPTYGDLKVATTHFSGGYLRKNGVPYSTSAELTEYWDLFKEPNGDERIMLSTRVTDPEYLSTPWVTVLQFKKEPSDAKWDPTPCSAKW